MGIGKTLNHADSGLIQNEKQLWNSEVLNMDNELQGLFMSENLRTVCICSKDERKNVCLLIFD